ncbi:unnamed protein product [Brachionus calyciflorus]|uniref:DDE-1 domain-containing protein n=1 Tax=Brachionus calyciflorus TaxID=104777 RepID=A0A814JUZ6_9BILA|nr:unnamed protein product [Brachionus calyciflorus]
MDNGKTSSTVKGFTIYHISSLVVDFDSITDIVLYERENKLLVEQLKYTRDKKKSFIKTDNVAFLPPNTTSVLQPMDAGFIKCYKGHYRVKFTRKDISYLEKDNFSKVFRPTLVNLFEALEMECSANNEAKQETICQPLEEHFQGETQIQEELSNDGEISEEDLDEKVCPRYAIRDYVIKVKNYGL